MELFGQEFLTLEGCYSCGDTIDEAKENIKDAITIYLEDLKEEGKPIPQPSFLNAELVTVLKKNLQKSQ